MVVAVLIDPASLTASTAVEIVKRHRRLVYGGQAWCSFCVLAWPCGSVLNARDVCRAAGLSTVNGDSKIISEDQVMSVMDETNPGVTGRQAATAEASTEKTRRARAI
jgi:hypothetical protein